MSPLLPAALPPPAPVLYVKSPAVALGMPSSSKLDRIWLEQLLNQTTAHVGTAVVDLEEATVGALNEIKEVSGFTWDQLARLFGVNRRSIHNWCNGEPMNKQNEARLFALRQLLTEVRAGSPMATRIRLIEGNGGLAPFDLIKEGRFDQARSVALGLTVVDDPLVNLLPPSRRALSEGVPERRDTPTLGELLEGPSFSRDAASEDVQ